MSRLIALLTDFGTTDHYVAVMKGVMLGINPDLRFVDLTHAIQPQNIRQAAFTLLNSFLYFPPRTIFLVVVDPGVGSSRKPIAMIAEGQWFFVAPDNGILSYVRTHTDSVTVTLDNPAYRLDDTSNTFHGRDIFAPAAAHLASGISLEQFGSWLENPVMLPEPRLVTENETRISGEVMYFDHFGSAVTSIGLLEWSSANRLTFEAHFGESAPEFFSAENAMVTVGSQQIKRIRHTYAEVAKGEPLALVGSSDFLEISVNQGNFAQRYGVHIGDPVEIQFADRIR